MNTGTIWSPFLDAHEDWIRVVELCQRLDTLLRLIARAVFAPQCFNEPAAGCLPKRFAAGRGLRWRVPPSGVARVHLWSGRARPCRCSRSPVPVCGEAKLRRWIHDSDRTMGVWASLTGEKAQGGKRQRLKSGTLANSRQEAGQGAHPCQGQRRRALQPSHPPDAEILNP